MSDESAFSEWCLVELMGHRKVAAKVTEQAIAGHGFLRLDEPDGRTQFVAPSSVYALHPTTEDTVRTMVRVWRTESVSRWELPAAAPAPVERDAWDDGEDPF